MLWTQVNINLTEGEDLTEWAYCPNPAACPGGFLEASTAPGQPIEALPWKVQLFDDLINLI